MDRKTKLFYSNIVNGLFFLSALGYITTKLLRQSVIGHYSVSMNDITFLVITLLAVSLVIITMYLIPGLFIIEYTFNISVKPSLTYIKRSLEYVQFSNIIKRNKRITLCVYRC